MTNKLYRSRNDKKIAGVCGGIATFTGIDATVVRIIFFILILPGGLPGVLPYALLWLFMPLEPKGEIIDQ